MDFQLHPVRGIGDITCKRAHFICRQHIKAIPVIVVYFYNQITDYNTKLSIFSNTHFRSSPKSINLSLKL